MLLSRLRARLSRGKYRVEGVGNRHANRRLLPVFCAEISKHATLPIVFVQTSDLNYTIPAGTVDKSMLRIDLSVDPRDKEYSMHSLRSQWAIGLKRALCLLMGVLALVLCGPPASADVGPKPEIDVAVYQDNLPVSENPFYAHMLSCSTVKSAPIGGCNDAPAVCGKFASIDLPDAAAGCSWSQAPTVWGGECRDGSCHFSYFLPARFRMAVYLPVADQLFISDEIERANLYHSYRVDLRAEGSAQITETTPLARRGHFGAFAVALALTLVVELLVATLYLFLAHIRRRVLWTVLLGNLVTLPIVWFVLSRVTLVAAIPLILAYELFAVVAEAGLIYALNRRLLRFKSALLLSFLMNAASFVIGLPAAGFMVLLGY